MSASQADWARARADYEAGRATDKDLAQRLGVHPSTVGRRRSREGWRTPAPGGAPPALSGATTTQSPGAEPSPADESAGQGARDPDATVQSPDNAGVRLGDAEPALDLTNPVHQRAILDAAMGIRRGEALEDHLDQLLEDQREARAERYRPVPWWRIPF